MGPDRYREVLVLYREGDQIYPRKWNHDFIGLVPTKNSIHIEIVAFIESQPVAFPLFRF